MMAAVTTVRITAGLLDEKGACPEQIGEFLLRWPDGVDVSVEAAVAVAGLFDWHWAAGNLLTVQAWEQYEAVLRQPWERYQVVERPAWEQYEAARLAGQYGAMVERQAWEEYKAVRRPAWEQYLAVCARAFAECALSHGLAGGR